MAVSQYIVKKFILLVVFLDQAKLTRLIDHDPCLFQLTSSIKVLPLLHALWVYQETESFSYYCRIQVLHLYSMCSC